LLFGLNQGVSYIVGASVPPLTPPGVPEGIKFSVYESIEYYRKGSTVYENRIEDAKSLNDVFVPSPDDVKMRVVTLRVANDLPIGLSGLSIQIVNVEGPIGNDYIPPGKIITADHLNPKDFRDFSVAEHQESPPSDRMCLATADSTMYYPCGLWPATTAATYTFYATAAESLSATIKVKVWVEDYTLHYKVL
jgi:hypothetical protein